MKNSIIKIFILAAMVVTSNAFADATVKSQNARTIGMGDARVAGGFGYNGFVDNPALLSRTQFLRISIANIPVSFNKDFMDVANFINDNKDNFQNYDEMSLADKQKFIKDLQKHDGKWVKVGVYPSVDISANLMGYGIGFAFYNTSDVGIKIDRGIYEPRVWGLGTSNNVAVLGVSKPLSIFVPGLTVGANLKYIQRYKADLFQIPATDLGNISDTTDPILDNAKDNVRKTIAFDAGALMELPLIDSEVGAVLNSIGDGRGASVDIGIAKRMLDNRLTLLGDYMDILDNNKENIFKKVHFGAQYQYMFMAVRAGVSSGYPTVGLGLDFKVIDIDAAYFSDELTKGPGGDEEQRYMVQAKIGW